MHTLICENDNLWGGCPYSDTCHKREPLFVMFIRCDMREILRYFNGMMYFV